MFEFRHYYWKNIIRWNEQYFVRETQEGGENFQVSYDDIVTKTSAERKSPAVTR